MVIWTEPASKEHDSDGEHEGLHIGMLPLPRQEFEVLLLRSFATRQMMSPWCYWALLASLYGK